MYFWCFTKRSHPKKRGMHFCYLDRSPSWEGRREGLTWIYDSLTFVLISVISITVWKCKIDKDGSVAFLFFFVFVLVGGGGSWANQFAASDFDQEPQFSAFWMQAISLRFYSVQKYSFAKQDWVVTKRDWRHTKNSEEWGQIPLL